MANSKMSFSSPSLLPFIGAMVLISAVSATPSLIPASQKKLDVWLARNMKDYVRHTRGIKEKPKFSLEKRLTAAEKAVRVIKVRKDGTGDFRTVMDAVNSVPAGNVRRVVISIGDGIYREKIVVDRSKPFVTFYGMGAMPTLTFDDTAKQLGTWKSASVAVESDYFVAVNIGFVNTAPMPDGRTEGSQAVALRISGDKAAFHGCKFIGYQDTLCDDKGRHFFRDCRIQGTVDFIFGNGKSLYLNTSIVSVAKRFGVITAQARRQVSDTSGFAFVHCNITGTGDTYLGRAWMERPRVVFAYSFMGTLINRQGWSNKNFQERNKTVYYAEYKCKGPGASTAGRVNYAKSLTEEQVKPFLSMTYIQGNKWLLPPTKLYF